MSTTSMRELNQNGIPKLSFIVEAPPAVIMMASENKTQSV